MSDQIQTLLARMTANDIGATTLPGAKVYYYQTGTTTPVSIWSNDACSIALANPLIADSVGRIPQVFYNSAFQVKVVVKTSADVLVDTIDPAPRWQSSTGAASNVSFTPSANVPQTNVQTAIDAVATQAFQFTKQTSISDTTAGRVMIVGAFGLGGFAPSSTLALALVAGKYLISDTDPANPIPGTSGALEVDRLGSVSIIQQFRSFAAVPQIYVRRSTDGGATWGAWSSSPPSYEVGNWFGVLSDGTNNATMSVTGCFYIKIGQLVTIFGRLVTTALGACAGAVRITGLPYAPNQHAAASAGFCTGMAIVAGTSVTMVATPGFTYMTLHNFDIATGVSSLQASEWSATGEMRFSLTYQTA